MYAPREIFGAVMVTDIKGRTQVEGFRKLGADEDICAEGRGRNRGMEKPA
jgi:hypothetical protein